MKHQESSELTTPRGLLWVLLIAFLAMTVVLLHEGYFAIRDKQYNLVYMQGTFAGRASYNQMHKPGDRTANYTGSDAIILGVGFTSTGIMCLTWSFGLVLSLLKQRNHHPPKGTKEVLGVLSMTALFMGCLGLFPPWRLINLPLYVVVAVFFAAVTLPLPKRIRFSVFPAYVAMVVLAVWLHITAGPLFAGFFVFLLAGGNLLFIRPELADRIGGKKSRRY